MPLKQASSFAELSAYSLQRINLGGDHPEIVQSAFCTPGLLRAFGVVPALGRWLEEGDERNGAPPVAVINQTAYVRDFDVEVAQAAFIADPKVDVIQDGLVLEVEPVILNDRKYILLKIDPTVAELQRPIPTFTTSLAGSTLPVTLQLPNLTVTNFSTTAKVPDGGTVLLGGLRQVLQRERRAEVPLLARLPLVAIFFKQEGTADENRSLMVMVRAQITDVVQDHPVGLR